MKTLWLCADEKEKYDPTGFRDAVIAGLEKTGGDLDAISKYLDSAGNKLDYRRYGEVLFDILIAGGLLVPGGSISQDGEKPSTDCCIFTASEDLDAMHSHEQVFIKLMRRYKYLEKMFEEEMKKVLIFIKGFTPSERIKLARMTALWIGNYCIILCFFFSCIQILPNNSDCCLGIITSFCLERENIYFRTTVFVL